MCSCLLPPIPALSLQWLDRGADGGGLGEDAPDPWGRGHQCVQQCPQGGAGSPQAIHTLDGVS